MRRARGPAGLRTGAAVTCSLLVWLIASWTSQPVGTRSPVSDITRGEAIESLSVLAVIAAEGPATIQAKRGGFLRELPALASGARTGFRALGFIADVRLPALPITTSPLTAGLTRRGPPALALS